MTRYKKTLISRNIPNIKSLLVNLAKAYLRPFLTTLMLIGGIVGLAYLEWYYILLALVYTLVVNEIFCHRICSHDMFTINTDSYLYKILTFLASADLGYGPVKWLIISHPLHHIHSDKGPEDVMNWRYHWYSTLFVSPIPLKEVKPKNYDDYFNRRQEQCSYIFDDKWTTWCSDNQNVISITVMLFLLVVSPTLLLTMFVGRLLLSFMTGLAGFFGHIKNLPFSYRNFNTDDTTSNNIVLHYLCLGMFTSILQNNHHGAHDAVKPCQRWFEFDTSYFFLAPIKYFIEKKSLTPA